MRLTSADILQLIELTQQEVVVPATLQFPYTVTERRPGYSADPKRAQLQAKLSVALEVARQMEGVAPK